MDIYITYAYTSEELIAQGKEDKVVPLATLFASTVERKRRIREERASARNTKEEAPEEVEKKRNGKGGKK